jgi:sarcosine oxidase subunit beta
MEQVLLRPGKEGLFLAVGFGGHGFQHSPATRRLVAEWLTDGAPSMDLPLFDSARFARGAPTASDARPDVE